MYKIFELILTVVLVYVVYLFFIGLDIILRYFNIYVSNYLEKIDIFISILIVFICIE